MSEGPFSHVLITRPESEGRDLAARLAPLLDSAGTAVLLQPAHQFCPVQLDATTKAELEALLGPGSTAAGMAATIIFSSPRSVEFGLSQISRELLRAASLAAMGPATARALESAGNRVATVAPNPHNSEAMMAVLSQRMEGAPGAGASAIIVTAGNGRQALTQWLQERGCQVLKLLVYERRPLQPQQRIIIDLAGARRVLSLWTSADAMNAMSRVLPPAAWFRICRGSWLVTSPRLQRLARAFGPSSVHLSTGPSNDEIASSVRALFLKQDG